MREVQEKQDAPCQRKCCSKFQFLWSFIIESSSVGQIPAVCGERTILLPIGTPPLGLRCFPRPCQSKSSRCWSKTMRSAMAVWGVWLWIQQLTIEMDGLILPYASWHRGYQLSPENRHSSHDISDNSEPWGGGHPQRSSTKVQEFFVVDSRL